MMRSDEQLIAGCLKGDKLSQRDLYDKYSRKMFGVCLRSCNRREEAEEVLQEGLLKVFHNLKDFKREGPLESWIKRIIINTALDFYRRNKNRQQETEWQENIIISIEPLTELKTKELLKIIQSLPLGFRTVFNLYAIEGYNHAEIGDMLNISEGTSKSQYSRARQHLMTMIEKEKKTIDSSNNNEASLEHKIIPLNSI